MTATNTAGTGRRTALERTRNIGIAAHIDAGKTTISERILALTGRVHRIGEVHDGQATMDSMDQERERGITIGSAATSCTWRDTRLQLIDTPGHVDFTIEVERSLRVLDGAIAVLDGVAGVEPQTETIWRQADRYAVPRVVFVNKMDRSGADFGRCVDELAKRLETHAVPVQIPMGSGSEFVGIIDVIGQRAYTYDGIALAPTETDIPDAWRERAEVARHELVEAIAETDDMRLDIYLTGGDFTDQQLETGLRAATLRGELVPVLCGSALKNAGIGLLLDAVIAYLPSPIDGGAITGEGPEGIETREPSIDAPFAALAFKIVADDYGRLTYLRVYSGRISVGDTVANVATGKRERIGRIGEMHADSRAERSEATAGDIVAIIGLKDIGTGHSLSDPKHPIALESLTFPEPVIAVAIEPKTKTDSDRLGKALGSLLGEDPSLRAHVDEDTGQTILEGMGELHLEVRCEQLRRDHRVAVDVGAPQVSYRETIGDAVSGITFTLAKQTGGSGQYAKIVFDIAPGEPGSGLTFAHNITGGRITREYINAVEAGMREAMTSGIYGYPVVDIEVRLTDGHMHEVDSSEMAFRTAGAKGLRQALAAARPVLLEPIMAVEVLTPDDYLGVSSAAGCDTGGYFLTPSGHLAP